MNINLVQTKHIAKVNKMFREQKEPLTAVIAKVKRAVGDYRMEEERKARKEEERLKSWAKFPGKECHKLTDNYGSKCHKNPRVEIIIRSCENCVDLE